MPGEQQTEEEEEEEMQEEMVLLVKGEEDEGEEKYEVVKLKIPMDNKEVRVPHPGVPSPLNLVQVQPPSHRIQGSCPYFPLTLRVGHPSFCPTIHAAIIQMSRLLCQALCWVLESTRSPRFLEELDV